MINRAELRLVLTTGLMNGFASISGLPFGYYAPMAVLAVCGGTYGTSLELGRQRILGSILGMVVLLVSLKGLPEVPMPLGMALALGAMRGLGGVLGLRAGYKVGGMIVVMGWLPHEEQLATWVPLRLLWTIVGILVSLLSLNLLWPRSGRAACQTCLAELFAGLAADLEREAAPATSGAIDARATTWSERHATLREFRNLLPALAQELGDQPLRHPAHQLAQSFEEAASRLLGASHALSALPTGPAPELNQLREGEAALLQALAERLRLWCRSLQGRAGGWPPLPAGALVAPPLWLAIEEHFSHPDLDALPPLRLERLAARLTLCRQALQAMETAERSWAALSPRPPQSSSRLMAQRSSAAG